MRQLALIVGTVLVVAFVAVNGVLMLVSPRRHAAFARWYTRGTMLSLVKPGAETRLAGFVLVAMCTFIGWVLFAKMMTR